MRPAPGTATETDVVAALEGPNKRLVELVQGVLIEKVMGTEESLLASWLIGVLWKHLEGKNLGIVLGALCLLFCHTVSAAAGLLGTLETTVTGIIGGTIGAGGLAGLAGTLASLSELADELLDEAEEEKLKNDESLKWDDRGGYNTYYAVDHRFGHWVAVAGVCLLAIALARTLVRAGPPARAQ